ncbi:hypothetical protein ACW5DW_06960 [Luteimonas sp. A482]
MQSRQRREMLHACAALKEPADAMMLELLDSEAAAAEQKLFAMKVLAKRCRDLAVAR